MSSTTTRNSDTYRADNQAAYNRQTKAERQTADKVQALLTDELGSYCIGLDALRGSGLVLILAHGERVAITIMEPEVAEHESGGALGSHRGYTY